jgi:rSAM/selenodomain-associated transferase 2
MSAITNAAQRPWLSIVIPTLNEADGIGQTLSALRPLTTGGVQTVVADGASTDGTAAIAHEYGATVIAAPRGRAMQMNAGASAAQGDVLLFLHADTMLPAAADRLIRQAVDGAGRHVWGRFDVCITGRPFMLKVVARFINWRSRMTGIATGDQALFMTRAAFNAVGGFAEQPLMEDVEMSRRLLRLSRPACLAARVFTSGRRWEKHGVWHTIFLMWRLRFAYWRGAAPERLAALYR